MAGGVPSALVTALLVWITTNTPYEMPENRSEIYMDHPRVIENMKGSAHTDSLTFLALYQDGAERIFLSNTLDLNDESVKGKLAHELVHWLQDIQADKIDYKCKNHEEYHAYLLQEKYYGEKQIESDIDWTYVNGTFYRCRMRGK